MRAALVSATSLAFEVGLDVAIDAQPARAQATFGVSSQTLNFGYVLLTSSGGTTASLTETVTNSYSHHNTITFPGAISPFSGAQSIVTLSNTIGTTVSAAKVYTFSPSVTSSTIAGPREIVTITASHGGNLNGTPVPVTLTGVAVAPVASITLNPYARVGGGAQIIAAITVSNAGDGDLSPGGSMNAAAQLKGSIGAISGSVFARSGSTTTFSLNDSNYSGPGTATTTAAFNYVYTPTSRGPGGTGSLTIALTNGNSNGTNTPTVSTVTLTGAGVGPTYQSSINGSTFSNSTNVGHNTIAAGTISTGTSKASATSAVAITLSNMSTDPGAATLTDLTLENFTLSGTNAADFSVRGFTTDTLLAEAASVTVMLDFSGPTVGSYNATLRLPPTRVRRWVLSELYSITSCRRMSRNRRRCSPSASAWQVWVGRVAVAPSESAHQSANAVSADTGQMGDAACHLSRTPLPHRDEPCGGTRFGRWVHCR